MPNENTKHFYNAFGLNIESNFEIEGMQPASNGGDVTIGNVTVDEDYLLSEFSDATFFEKDQTYIWIAPQKVCYIWDGFGAAVVRNGNSILLDSYSDESVSKMSPFVTGALFGHLLNQRGVTVLHGSSVCKDGNVWIFLGDKGAGKSTTAMSLVSHGYSVFTDDLVPVIHESEGIYTRPGFPRSKLWPDSAKTLGLEIGSLPRLMPFVEKRGVQLSPSDVQIAQVKGVFILQTSTEPAIEQLSGGSAFFEIQKNLYLVNYLAETSAAQRGFDDCERMVKELPVYQLSRPDSFGGIDKLVSLVTAQMEEAS